MCMCVYLCGGEVEGGECRVGNGGCGSWEGQRNVSNLLELEIKVVVSFLTWVLGNEFWAPGRAARAHNH